MLPEVARLPAAHPGRRVVVLASGDPMFSGIGTTLVRWFGAAAVDVVPHPSSVTLACSRMGWSVEETTVVSVVWRPLELLVPHVTPGRRLVVLGAGTTTPGEVADRLTEWGYGASDPASFGTGLRTTVDGNGASWTAWVTDNAWTPPMFADSSLTTLTNFGMLAKTWLAATATSNWVQ